MPKLYNDPTVSLPRLNEDVWFEAHQELLLQMVNTLFGRELLHIPKEYPQIFKIQKNCVHWRNEDGTCGADFRVGAKWGNVIRYKWDAFCSYARYFSAPRVFTSTMELQVPMSSLTRYSRSVYAATLTAYPEPNVETATFDGHCIDDNGSWDGVHDASASDGSDDSGTTLQCASGKNFDSSFTIFRPMALFDTSSLTAAANVTAATVQLYITTVQNDFNNAQAYATMMNSNPASNTAIANADYDQVGDAINNPTKYSDDIAFNTLSTSTYEVWTLNATGRAYVSLTGITKLGWRDGRDIEDSSLSGVSPGQRNKFVCSSADESGTSQDPKLVITYVAITAPSNVVATPADGSTSITVTWDDNSDNEDGFSIEASADGSTGWAEVGDVGAGVEQYVHAVGTNSTIQYYRVRATLGGDFSSYSSVSASATTAPAAPSGFTASPVDGTPTSMALAWTDNSSDETSFSIERSADGISGWAEVLTPAAEAESATDTGLTGDTTYHYRIRAIRSGDGIDSAYSTSDSGQTGPATPTNAAAAPVDGTDDILITWDDNATTETSYVVERSDDGSTGWADVSGALSPGVESYQDNVGAASTEKFYRVKAVRSGDSMNSAYSSTVSATTPPAAPSGVAVAAVDGSYNLTVTWTDNSSDETGFSVERSDNGSTGWAEVGTAAAEAESYTDTTVGAGDLTRYYRVIALRSGDTTESAASSSGNGVSSPQAPTTPAVTFDGLVPTLTWVDNSSTETGFVVERKLGSGSYATVGTPAAEAETFEDSALSVGKTYTYRLKAARSSDSKNSPSVTLEFDVPPEAPTNLNGACTVRATSNGSKIKLWWEINSTEETGFLIERSLNGSAWSTVTTTAAGVRTYEDTGLAHDTTYYYRVSAVGSAETSAPATAITVKTSRGNVAALLMAFDKKTGNFPLS